MAEISSPKPLTVAMYAVGALLVCALLYQGIRESREEQPIHSGKAAPAFSLEKFEGGKLSLAELKGKVVMLDFWATWCPPCVAELPSLVKLADEYRGRGVVLVAANRDDPEVAREVIAAFMHQRVSGLDHRVVIADDTTADRYHVSALPTLYIIGRNGDILDATPGFSTEQDVRAQLEQALR